MVLRFSLCCLLACGAGCGSSSQPIRKVVEIKSSESTYELRAPYAATLLRAVESISRVRFASHPSQYRAWFPDWVEKIPDWAIAYRNAQAYWKVPAYYRGLEMGSVQRLCSYEDVSVPELVRCLQSMIDAKYHHIVSNAVYAMDSRLRPRWGTGLQARDFRVAFERLLRTKKAQRLISELRWFMELRPQDLQFKIILSLVPPLAEKREVASYAHGEYFVLGVNPNRPAEWHMQVLMHELAHIAVNRTKFVDQFEHGLRGGGYAGVIAGGHWNEAIATAFGEGLAAARFIDDPNARRRDWYSNPVVSKLAKRLYAYWSLDRSLRFGSVFASKMVEFTKEVRPPAEYVLQDFLFRFQLWVFSDQINAIVRRELDSRQTWFGRYLGKKISRPRYPTLPRLVFATQAQLLSKPALVTGLSLSSSKIKRYLAQHPAALWWSDSATGAPMVAVIARNEKILKEQTVLFCRRASKTMPTLGWNPLPLAEVARPQY